MSIGIHRGIGLYVGSDPEIFVKNGNDLIPAWDFLPDKHHPIHGAHRGLPVYWDGFQAEFTTSPQVCYAYNVDDIYFGLRAVLIAAREKHPKAQLSIDSAPRIPIEILRAAEEQHVMLGCDPSQNAYFMSGKFVDDPRRLRFRFAGGHIHFSGIRGIPTDNLFEERQRFLSPFVKTLDAILGVFFVGAAASFDSPIRREYYGLAGEYRMPPHGLEYRVLSNIWLCHPGITHLAYNLSRGVLSLVENNLQKWWIAPEAEVIETINTCNVSLARKLLKQNKPLFNEIYSAGISMEQFDATELAYEVGQHGIEMVIKDPTDIEKNWHLDKADWVNHSEAGECNWYTTANAYLQRTAAE